MSELRLYPGARVRADNGVEGIVGLNQNHDSGLNPFFIQYPGGTIYYCREDGTNFDGLYEHYRPVEILPPLPEATATTLLDRIAGLERRIEVIESLFPSRTDPRPLPAEKPIVLSPDVWAIVESEEYPEGVLCDVKHSLLSKWYLMIYGARGPGWYCFENGVHTHDDSIRVVRTIPKYKGGGK